MTVPFNILNVSILVSKLRWRRKESVHTEEEASRHTVIATLFGQIVLLVAKRCIISCLTRGA